ncbi:unnamed protein product [Echinostoma caproni]|uniref:39S ribosomal protein L9, mitochondrial n=1 Tax=Echinostoma caproni TaxID=27848 RepID=A0A183A0D6_9TREM|nr:unnamed protein product [Echinostoma caproni]
MGRGSHIWEAIDIVESGTMFVDGNFVVPLPWKKGVNTDLGNYASALSRLNSLKRRSINDEALRFRYAQTMKMTIEKKYAVTVPEEQVHCDFHPRWYLPHHAVLNPKKPEKLRIVLDCAVKHKGQTLNDMLYQVPDTTANLVGILLRFRKEHVVFPRKALSRGGGIQTIVEKRHALDHATLSLRLNWYYSQVNRPI